MTDENSYAFDMADYSNASFPFGQCEACTCKDEELQALKKETDSCQASFKFLKRKIIATDQLLRQYKTKMLCTDLEKQIEEWTRKYEKIQREVTVLEVQLKKAVEDLEPVRRSKTELDQELKKVEKEKEALQEKLKDAQYLNRQYQTRIANLETAHSFKEVSGDMKKKVTQLENRIKQHGNTVTKLKMENMVLKTRESHSQRLMTRLESRLQHTQDELSKNLSVLVENGLMTEKGKNKVMATVRRLDKDDDNGDDDNHGVNGVSDSEGVSLSEFESDEEDIETRTADTSIPDPSTSRPSDAEPAKAPSQNLRHDNTGKVTETSGTQPLGSVKNVTTLSQGRDLYRKGAENANEILSQAVRNVNGQSHGCNITGKNTPNASKNFDKAARITKDENQGCKTTGNDPKNDNENFDKAVRDMNGQSQRGCSMVGKDAGEAGEKGDEETVTMNIQMLGTDTKDVKAKPGDHTRNTDKQIPGRHVTEDGEKQNKGMTNMNNQSKRCDDSFGKEIDRVQQDLKSAITKKDFQFLGRGRAEKRGEQSRGRMFEVLKMVDMMLDCDVFVQSPLPPSPRHEDYGGPKDEILTKIDNLFFLASPVSDVEKSSVSGDDLENSTVGGDADDDDDDDFMGSVPFPTENNCHDFDADTRKMSVESASAEIGESPDRMDSRDGYGKQREGHESESVCAEASQSRDDVESGNSCGEDYEHSKSESVPAEAYQSRGKVENRNSSDKQHEEGNLSEHYHAPSTSETTSLTLPVLENKASEKVTLEDAVSASQALSVSETRSWMMAMVEYKDSENVDPRDIASVCQAPVTSETSSSRSSTGEEAVSINVDGDNSTSARQSVPAFERTSSTLPIFKDVVSKKVNLENEAVVCQASLAFEKASSKLLTSEDAVSEKVEPEGRYMGTSGQSAPRDLASDSSDAVANVNLNAFCFADCEQSVQADEAWESEHVVSCKCIPDGLIVQEHFSQESFVSKGGVAVCSKGIPEVCGLGVCDQTTQRDAASGSGDAVYNKLNPDVIDVTITKKDIASESKDAIGVSITQKDITSQSEDVIGVSITQKDVTYQSEDLVNPDVNCVTVTQKDVTSQSEDVIGVSITQKVVTYQSEDLVNPDVNCVTVTQKDVTSQSEDVNGVTITQKDVTYQSEDLVNPDVNCVTVTQKDVTSLSEDVNGVTITQKDITSLSKDVNGVTITQKDITSQSEDVNGVTIIQKDITFQSEDVNNVTITQKDITSLSKDANGVTITQKDITSQSEDVNGVTITQKDVTSQSEDVVNPDVNCVTITQKDITSQSEDVNGVTITQKDITSLSEDVIGVTITQKDVTSQSEDVVNPDVNGVTITQKDITSRSEDVYGVTITQKDITSRSKDVNCVTITQKDVTSPSEDVNGVTIAQKDITSRSEDIVSPDVNGVVTCEQFDQTDLDSEKTVSQTVSHGVNGVVTAERPSQADFMTQSAAAASSKVSPEAVCVAVSEQSAQANVLSKSEDEVSENTNHETSGIAVCKQSFQASKPKNTVSSSATEDNAVAMCKQVLTQIDFESDVDSPVLVSSRTELCCLSNRSSSQQERQVMKNSESVQKGTTVIKMMGSETADVDTKPSTRCHSFAEPSTNHQQSWPKKTGQPPKDTFSDSARSMPENVVEKEDQTPNDENSDSSESTAHRMFQKKGDSSESEAHRMFQKKGDSSESTAHRMFQKKGDSSESTAHRMFQKKGDSSESTAHRMFQKKGDSSESTAHRMFQKKGDSSESTAHRMFQKKGDSSESTAHRMFQKKGDSSESTAHRMFQKKGDSFESTSHRMFQKKDHYSDSSESTSHRMFQKKDHYSDTSESTAHRMFQKKDQSLQHDSALCIPENSTNENVKDSAQAPEDMTSDVLGNTAQGTKEKTGQSSSTRTSENPENVNRGTTLNKVQLSDDKISDCCENMTQNVAENRGGFHKTENEKETAEKRKEVSTVQSATSATQKNESSASCALSSPQLSDTDNSNGVFSETAVSPQPTANRRPVLVNEARGQGREEGNGRVTYSRRKPTRVKRRQDLDLLQSRKMEKRLLPPGCRGSPQHSTELAIDQLIENRTGRNRSRTLNSRSPGISRSIIQGMIANERQPSWNGTSDCPDNMIENVLEKTYQSPETRKKTYQSPETRKSDGSRKISSTDNPERISEIDSEKEEQPTRGRPPEVSSANVSESIPQRAAKQKGQPKKSQTPHINSSDAAGNIPLKVTGKREQIKRDVTPRFSSAVTPTPESVSGKTAKNRGPQQGSGSPSVSSSEVLQGVPQKTAEKRELSERGVAFQISSTDTTESTTQIIVKKRRRLSRVQTTVRVNQKKKSCTSCASVSLKSQDDGDALVGESAVCSHSTTCRVHVKGQDGQGRRNQERVEGKEEGRGEGRRNQGRGQGKKNKRGTSPSTKQVQLKGRGEEPDHETMNTKKDVSPDIVPSPQHRINFALDELRAQVDYVRSVRTKFRSRNRFPIGQSKKRSQRLSVGKADSDDEYSSCNSLPLASLGQKTKKMSPGIYSTPRVPLHQKRKKTAVISVAESSVSQAHLCDKRKIMTDTDTDSDVPQAHLCQEQKRTDVVSYLDSSVSQVHLHRQRTKRAVISRSESTETESGICDVKMLSSVGGNPKQAAPSRWRNKTVASDGKPDSSCSGEGRGTKGKTSASAQLGLKGVCTKLNSKPAVNDSDTEDYDYAETAIHRNEDCITTVRPVQHLHEVDIIDKDDDVTVEYDVAGEVKQHTDADVVKDDITTECDVTGEAVIHRANDDSTVKFFRQHSKDDVCETDFIRCENGITAEDDVTTDGDITVKNDITSEGGITAEDISLQTNHNTSADVIEQQADDDFTSKCNSTVKDDAITQNDITSEVIRQQTTNIITTEITRQQTKDYITCENDNIVKDDITAEADITTEAMRQQTEGDISSKDDITTEDNVDCEMVKHQTEANVIIDFFQKQTEDDVADKTDAIVEGDIKGKSDITDKDDVTDRSDITGRRKKTGKDAIIGKDENDVFSEALVIADDDENGTTGKDDVSTEAGIFAEVITDKTDVADKDDITGRSDITGRNDNIGKDTTFGKDEYEYGVIANDDKIDITGKDDITTEAGIISEDVIIEKSDVTGKDDIADKHDITRETYRTEFTKPESRLEETVPSVSQDNSVEALTPSSSLCDDFDPTQFSSSTPYLRHRPPDGAMSCDSNCTGSDLQHGQLGDILTSSTDDVQGDVSFPSGVDSKSGVSNAAVGLNNCVTEASERMSKVSSSDSVCSTVSDRVPGLLHKECPSSMITDLSERECLLVPEVRARPSELILQGVKKECATRNLSQEDCFPVTTESSQRDSGLLLEEHSLVETQASPKRSVLSLEICEMTGLPHWLSPEKSSKFTQRFSETKLPVLPGISVEDIPSAVSPSLSAETWCKNATEVPQTDCTLLPEASASIPDLSDELPRKESSGVLADFSGGDWPLLIEANTRTSDTSDKDCSLIITELSERNPSLLPKLRSGLSVSVSQDAGSRIRDESTPEDYKLLLQSCSKDTCDSCVELQNATAFRQVQSSDLLDPGLETGDKNNVADLGDSIVNDTTPDLFLATGTCSLVQTNETRSPQLTSSCQDHGEIGKSDSSSISPTLESDSCLARSSFQASSSPTVSESAPVEGARERLNGTSIAEILSFEMESLTVRGNCARKNEEAMFTTSAESSVHEDSLIVMTESSPVEQASKEDKRTTACTLITTPSVRTALTLNVSDALSAMQTDENKQNSSRLALLAQSANDQVRVPSVPETFPVDQAQDAQSSLYSDCTLSVPEISPAAQAHEVDSEITASALHAERGDVLTETVATKQAHKQGDTDVARSDIADTLVLTENVSKRQTREKGKTDMARASLQRNNTLAVTDGVSTLQAHEKENTDLDSHLCIPEKSLPAEKALERKDESAINAGPEPQYHGHHVQETFLPTEAEENLCESTLCFLAADDSVNMISHLKVPEAMPAEDDVEREVEPANQTESEVLTSHVDAFSEKPSETLSNTGSSHISGIVSPESLHGFDSVCSADHPAFQPPVSEKDSAHSSVKKEEDNVSSSHEDVFEELDSVSRHPPSKDSISEPSASAHTDSKDSVSAHTDSKDSASTHTDSKDSASAHTDSKDSASAHTDSKDSASTHTDSKDSASAHTDSKDSASAHTDSKDSASAHTDSKDSASEYVELEASTSEHSASKDSLSRYSQSKESTSGHSASKESASTYSDSNESTSGHSASTGSASGYSESKESASDPSTSKDSASRHSKSMDSRHSRLKASRSLESNNSASGQPQPKDPVTRCSPSSPSGHSESKDSALRDSELRDSALRDSKPRDSASRHSESKESALRDSESKDSASRDSESKDSALRDSESKDSTSRHSESKDSASRLSESKDSTSRDSEPKDSTSRHSESKDSTSRHSEPKDSTSRHSESKDPAPRHSQSKDPAPRHSQSKDPAPRHSQSKDPAPRHSQSKDPAPRHSESKDSAPRHSESNDSTSKHSKTKDLTSEGSRLGHSESRHHKSKHSKSRVGVLHTGTSRQPQEDRQILAAQKESNSMRGMSSTRKNSSPGDASETAHSMSISPGAAVQPVPRIGILQHSKGFKRTSSGSSEHVSSLRNDRPKPRKKKRSKKMAEAISICDLFSTFCPLSPLPSSPGKSKRPKLNSHISAGELMSSSPPSLPQGTRKKPQKARSGGQRALSDGVRQRKQKGDNGTESKKPHSGLVGIFTEVTRPNSSRSVMSRKFPAATEDAVSAKTAKSNSSSSSTNEKAAAKIKGDGFSAYHRASSLCLPAGERKRQTEANHGSGHEGRTDSRSLSTSGKSSLNKTVMSPSSRTSFSVHSRTGERKSASAPIHSSVSGDALPGRQSSSYSPGMGKSSEANGATLCSWSSRSNSPFLETSQKKGVKKSQDCSSRSGVSLSNRLRLSRCTEVTRATFSSSDRRGDLWKSSLTSQVELARQEMRRRQEAAAERSRSSASQEPKTWKSSTSASSSSVTTTPALQPPSSPVSVTALRSVEKRKRLTDRTQPSVVDRKGMGSNATYGDVLYKDTAEEEDLDCVPVLKKARLSCTGDSGSVVDWKQGVEALVTKYYRCRWMSVQTFVSHLSRIGRPTASEFWMHLVQAVIQILKEEDVDLQSQIVSECAAHSHRDVSAQKSLICHSFLSHSEQRFVPLLVRLMEMDSVHSCERVQLMRSLWTAIFAAPGNFPCISTTQQASLCRLFVGICRAEGRVEEARVLTFDLVKTGQVNVVVLMLAVAGAWPLVLSRDGDTGHVGILAVLEHVVMSAVTGSHATKKLGVCFERLCGWRQTTEDSTWVLARHVRALMTTVEQEGSTTSAVAYELSCCVELLCAVEGASWMVQNCVERFVYPAWESWMCRDQEGRVSRYRVVIFCRIVGKLSSPALKCKERTVHQLIKHHARKLLTTKIYYEDVEEACVEMLLRLAPLSPALTFSVLRSWHSARSQRSSARGPLIDRIMALRSVVLSRVPHVKLDTLD